MVGPITFGIFADLHVDIIHDALDRLDTFLEQSKERDVDFIIELGDFCYPETRKCICKPENRPVNIQNSLTFPTYAPKDLIISHYQNFNKPAYHVLGNHDGDMCSKKDVLAYYDSYGGHHEPYYSFNQNGIHFIVLDCNYYMQNGQFISFSNGNYFDAPFEGGNLPWLPPEEVEWLKNDLNQTTCPSVLFSHQRLYGGYSCIHNSLEVMQILKEAPSGIIMVINGHEHLDDLRKEEGIWFYNVNSMSNFWVGEDYEVLGRYGDEMDEKYPNLRYVIPYAGPIYSFVTIQESEIHIRGVTTDFVGKTPIEMGLWKGKPLYEIILQSDITAESKDHDIVWK